MSRCPGQPSGGACPGGQDNYAPEYLTVDAADPMNYSDRSLNQYESYMPAQSTPANPRTVPRGHDTFGSQIEYDLSWMPQDIQLSDLAEPPSRPSGRYRDPNLNLPGSATIDTRYLEQLSEEAQGDSATNSPVQKPPRQESLLEWFDRSVEKELKKRREGSLNVGENLVNLETPTNVKDKSRRSHPNMLTLEASMSGIDITSKLRSGMDTELLEAVDKLAKAEAMITFEGAVRAAEEAAAAAPPEFAEEAAAARVQDFQAEVTGVVKHEFTGSKPIEVIGYVGITRPKKPKKSECPC